MCMQSMCVVKYESPTIRPFSPSIITYNTSENHIRPSKPVDVRHRKRGGANRTTSKRTPSHKNRPLESKRDKMNKNTALIACCSP